MQGAGRVEHATYDALVSQPDTRDDNSSANARFGEARALRRGLIYCCVTDGRTIMSAGAKPWRRLGLASVIALVAVVSSLTAIQRVGAVPLASLAASPREVADGRLWLLISSGAIAADPLLWSLLSFCGLAFLTFALCGWRILWFAALTGQTFSTLLGYSIIGVARLVEPRAFERLVSAPDYGVSAISAAWLGAVAAVGWRKRGESTGRAAIVLGCVAAASLAWFVRGRGLDVLDSEHVFAFAIGVGVASGRVLPDAMRFPRLFRDPVSG